MQVTDFTVGKSYIAKRYPFVPGEGDPVPQEDVAFKVLAPVRAGEVYDGTAVTNASLTELENWSKFLHILNFKTGKSGLLHPGTIESVTVL